MVSKIQLFLRVFCFDDQIINFIISRNTNIELRCYEKKLILLEVKDCCPSFFFSLKFKF